jgi:hypothetical protein
MKIRKILSTVFGFLALSSGSLWFGAYIARLLVTYQMFEPKELLLKSFLSNSDLPAIFQTIFPLINLTLFSYLMMIVSFTIFIMSTDLKLKENGWLFIISMIIYLTLPLETVLLSIDYKLFIIIINEQFSSNDILKLIVQRITILSSFPVILILSYLTIPYFLVVKPFSKKSKNED